MTDDPVTIARLEQENEALRERVAALREDLAAIATWREACHRYDADMSHEARAFADAEEWDLVESAAMGALDRDDDTVEVTP
jgi:hypothetical protein